ncbi:alpha-1,2-fucosyltransferase [Flavobacterium sp.]|uniref:alpha-1,2-fucosyltransferase n=1 Tax=Flavobacterium sp. TaxID=239 RepID=UPI0033404125
MFKRKKTVIVKLQGGLGNQMFQYAVAKGIGFERVFFDLSFLRKHSVSTNDFTAREFELLIFKNIKVKEIIKTHFKFLKSKKINKLLGYKFNFITQIENEFVDIDKNSDVIYLDGYFQSEKYFSHCRELILNDFEYPELDTKNLQIKNQITSFENSVSVHIRRGDFIKSKAILDIHGVVPLEFYQTAIDKLIDIYGDIKLYFFSEDMNFVKENFKSYPNLFFVEGNVGSDSWKDMALMSSCKHHIIANSSFSWWAAWLSKEDGITFAPRHFFNPKVNYEINDFMPERWQIIDYKF